MPRTKKAVEKKVEKTTKVLKKSNLSLTIYDVEGKEKKEVELPKEIFKVEVNPKLLAQYVRVYLANQRAGTASTKTRGEVVGSTRKIYRQKGTGRARHGDIRAPIFVGGGITFGPKPRDFSLKFNKKQKIKTLFGALSLKFKEKKILGLDDKALTIKPKTKNIVNFFNQLKISGQKNLLILPKMEKNNLVLASRNIPRTMFTEAKLLNAYLVLNQTNLIFIEEALTVFKNHFLKNADK
jgi:large subunit ribosomal protein L4